MCLYTNNKESKVLREPMTAYKIVAISSLVHKKVTINSVYYKQEWKLGRIYSLSKEDIEFHITPRPSKTHFDINVGFHLYIKDIEQHLNNYQTDPILEAAHIGPFAILEGVVPAGSYVWGSPDAAEIVSDCFVPKSCYTFIPRKPFLGIKRKPKKVYYDSDN